MSLNECHHINSELSECNLFPKYTFDNLVVDQTNRFAHAAAVQVTACIGGPHNPLFIYGKGGLGKTHLLHAIGNKIVHENPQKSVRYVHAEDFFAEVIHALQEKSIEELDRKYRAVDVLLLDDVQFFNGKNRTQELFLRLFNELIGLRKQVVITSDTCPKDVNGLDDDLIAGFDSGQVVQICGQAYVIKECSND